MSINIQYLSHSAINAFIACPRAWASKWIEKTVEAAGEAAMFGTHFEKIHCEDIGFQVAGEDRVKLERGEYRKKYGNQDLINAVAHYQKQSFAWNQADEAQKFMEIRPEQWAELAGKYGADPHLAMRLIGFIDLFRKTPESVGLADEIRPTELMDLKTISTDSWKPDWARQCTLYALATGASRWSIHRWVRGAPEKLACKVVDLNTPEARQLCKETMDTTAYYVRQIAAVIQDPGCVDHLPRASGHHCNYCPLYDKCPSGSAFGGGIPGRMKWAKKEVVPVPNYNVGSVDDLLKSMGDVNDE